MSITENEIASQPDVWAQAAARTDELADVLRAPGERMLVVGCGTSAFMAASIAALREAAGLGETDGTFPSEVPPGRRYDRVVALTRSGTTTEVERLLADLPGVRRSVITAVPDAPVARHAHEVVVLAEADERSVVQTRFPTTVLRVARAALGADVSHLDGQCRAALAAPLPVDVTAIDHVVYLGSGWILGLAHEAALKVREAAQAWSESYPAPDYRHGPIAVAGPRSLVWIFGAPPPGLVADVEATGAAVVVPDGDPLVQLVQAQRLATALAAHRGLDPDRPRHLTRSVVLGA
ncbi:SIS domain-containing protein [Pseudonocardia sp. CA-107938]|uniref:SIS domain-containing protein n=1 Tax=Pseudonocardia sp. CA-107938 TaxID=3240021 RepID=UPI003D8A4328